MAQGKWPVRVRKTQGVTSFVRTIAAVLAVGLSYTGTIVAAKNPDASAPIEQSATFIGASLSYFGKDVIITGSVNQLFTDKTFVGPNRAAKGPRRRPVQDVVEFARSFDDVRLQLANLRAQEAEALQQLARKENPLTTTAREKLSRIAIASIDPTLMSSALDAINSADSSSSDEGLPAPLSISSKLAYARANTPATIFKSPVSAKVSSKQLNCLATAIYFEARGESYRGQVAVAQVVMNRVKHRLYPNTVCGVVFQNQSKRNACQFSFACDGIPERVNEKKSWAQAEEIAQKVTNGSVYLTEVANATHYHASYVYPHWAKRMNRVAKIGLHRFYRFRRG